MLVHVLFVTLESSLKQLQGFQEDDFLCVLLGLIKDSEMASVQLKIFWLKARAPCLKRSSFLEESAIPKSSPVWDGE